jgi:DNA polymerase-3 subunit epsilon
MIHQLLTLTRPLFVLDCETTGLDVTKDRIVEIGFQRWTAEGMDKEWRTLVNPTVPIPLEVTKVHGITDGAFLRCRQCGHEHNRHPLALEPVGIVGDHLVEARIKCDEFKPWPRFAQIAARLGTGLSGCDFAGKNIRFDLRLIAAEMARASVEWSYAGARIIDAERLEQLAVPRTLSHLHEKYVGMKHDGAHDKYLYVAALFPILLLVVIVLMYALGTGYYAPLRRQLAGTDGAAAMTDAALAAYLDERRPRMLAGIGIFALLLIIWLMVLKPGG